MTISPGDLQLLAGVKEPVQGAREGAGQGAAWGDQKNPAEHQWTVPGCLSEVSQHRCGDLE